MVPPVIPVVAVSTGLTPTFPENGLLFPETPPGVPSLENPLVGRPLLGGRHYGDLERLLGLFPAAELLLALLFNHIPIWQWCHLLHRNPECGVGGCSFPVVSAVCAGGATLAPSWRDDVYFFKRPAVSISYATYV